MIGMTVFVLHTYWDTEDTEGNEVIGVFGSLQKAQEVMKREADLIKEDFSDDYWDLDYTWENEREIHLGHDDHIPFCDATVYCFSIEERVVL